VDRQILSSACQSVIGDGTLGEISFPEAYLLLPAAKDYTDITFQAEASADASSGTVSGTCNCLLGDVRLTSCPFTAVYTLPKTAKTNQGAATFSTAADSLNKSFLETITSGPVSWILIGIVVVLAAVLVSLMAAASVKSRRRKQIRDRRLQERSRSGKQQNGRSDN